MQVLVWSGLPPSGGGSDLPAGAAVMESEVCR